MRLPTMARSSLTLLTLAASGLLAGCHGESTAPAALKSAVVTSQRSPFVPSAAAKALVGVADGSYQFTVDPTVAQSINLGPNYLSLPANSVCSLASSSYGASFWNDACVPETAPVTITAVVRDATTDHPSIDFFPAMRFNPATNVGLYLYVPTGMDDFLRKWVLKYCNDANVCADESLSDPDLKSAADLVNKMVFRRIKHFSGYLVNYDIDPTIALPPI